MPLWTNEMHDAVGDTSEDGRASFGPGGRLGRKTQGSGPDSKVNVPEECVAESM